jgi:NAD(P)H-dependent FMN reductase
VTNGTNDGDGTRSDPLRLQVIVGSTREGRASDLVMPWLLDAVHRHPAFEVEVHDLREWPLPMFQETGATMRNGYSHEAVRRWNDMVASGDVYVFVTPEYNHSVPGVLKNAIDSVVASYAFRNKAAGFVGYSGGLVGGARAVEHLAAIAIEAELVPLRNAVLVAQVQRAFQADGRAVDPATDLALAILLDDLAWWGHALRRARVEGELLPSSVRRAAAMSAG